MKISYNSPVILSYAIVCSVVLMLTQLLGENFLEWFVLRPTFNPASLRDWFGLFSHAIGHGSWNHLLGNMMLILLVGPMLEEKYGGQKLLMMILITSLVTSVFNILIFNQSIIGASGVVFMMILLSSFSSFKKGYVPLTFVLIFVLYIGTEIVNGMTPDTISQTGHILGGLCGAVFGFAIHDNRINEVID